MKLFLVLVLAEEQAKMVEGDANPEQKIVDYEDQIVNTYIDRKGKLFPSAPAYLPYKHVDILAEEFEAPVKKIVAAPRHGPL